MAGAVRLHIGTSAFRSSPIPAGCLDTNKTEPIIMTISKVDTLSGLRILIVEDEALIAEHMRERLTQLGALVVDVVDSGPDALISAQWKRPELVLMDIELKGTMTGTDTAVEIRKLRAIPVIFLTGNSDWATIQKAKSIYWEQ